MVLTMKQMLISLVVLASILVIHQQSMASLWDPGEEVQLTMLLGQMRGPLQSEDPQLLDHLTKNFLFPPSTMPYNLTPDGEMFENYHRDSHTFGWKFLDYYIKLFFSDQKYGIFFEAGALNGEFNSNTLWLEQNNNWKGILVEPDPTNFKHLAWKQRKSWISNSCISGYKYPREILMQTLVKDPDPHNRQLRGAWLFRANAHEVGNMISDHPGPMASPSFSRAQCFPLYSYFAALNISTVDLLSLDMQGNEWNALKSLPWDSLKIRALFIEHIKNDITVKEIDEDFVKDMTKHGYRLVDSDDKHNYIFILKEDKILDYRTDPQRLKKYKTDVQIVWV
ncbi:unnamed protein product, partial [Meganyctiphanes norvegica]